MKKRLYNKLWTALAFAVWGSIFLTSCGTSSGNTLSDYYIIVVDYYTVSTTVDKNPLEKMK